MHLAIPTPLFRVLLALTLVAAVGACAPLQPQSIAPPRHQGLSADRASLTVNHVGSPTPDALADRRPYSTPTFPFLPGEDVSASVSVGNTSRGFIANALPVPPNPALHSMPKAYEREMTYGTRALIDTLQFAAEQVASQRDGALLYLGHIAQDGGGNIKWSVSHNNGRDADLSFYTTNPFGWTVQEPEFLHIGRDLVSREHFGFYRFDVPLNAKLLKALDDYQGSELQYVFVVNHLRRRLMAYLAEDGTDEAQMTRLNLLVRQPGGRTLPHNDHFHVRVYCDPDDLCKGCIDTGKTWDWVEERQSAVEQCAIPIADLALSGEDSDVRADAIRRLGLLDDETQHDLIAAALRDDEVAVRVAAVEALAMANKRAATYEIIAHDAVEEVPEVRCAIARTLGSIHRSYASEHLALMLHDDLSCPEFGQPETTVADATPPLALIVAQALENSESTATVPALIERLSDDRPVVRAVAAASLQKITNRRMRVGETAEALDWGSEQLDPDLQSQAVRAWREWYDDNKGERRSKWLISGFESEGFSIGSLSRDSLPKLVKAIKGPTFISFNAQRSLQRLTGQVPNADLNWTSTEASAFWRHYVHKRRDSASRD